MSLTPYGYVAVWKRNIVGPISGTAYGVEKKAFNIDDPEMADETEPDGEGWILDEIYPAEMEDTTAADDAYEVDR